MIRTMAFLEHIASMRRHILTSRCLIGRSRTSSLRLDGKRVSGEHAIVYWDGTSWLVRDLGSRNGTFVNGERITAGLPLPLIPGRSLAFGDKDDIWHLADDGPPGPMAVSINGHTQVTSHDGLLFLPDQECAEVTIYLDAERRWVAESAGDLISLHDGQIVTAGQERWRLTLPITLESTAGVTQAGPWLDRARLDFSVSGDQEHIEIILQVGDTSHHLPSRAHSYTLLTLAHLRQQEAGHLDDNDAGWVYCDDLADMLRVDRTLLNTYISRARRQIAAVGVPDAALIIERRPGTGQIRLGLRPDQITVRMA